MTTTEKYLAVILGFFGLVGIYFLQPILGPFLLGIVIAYLGDPLVDALERRGLGRTAGAAIVFLAFFLVFAGVLLVLIPILVKEIADLVRSIPAAISWMQVTVGPFMQETLGVDPFQLDTSVLKDQLAENWQQTGGIVGIVLREVTASSFAFMAAIMNIALTPVVAFYLMVDWDIVVARIREMIPRSDENMVVKLVTECDEVLSAFLRGQMMVMVLQGLFYSAGLMIIGLDLAVLIGMMAGLASIVPYLGFVVGIGAALIAAAFQFQDFMHPGYVVIVFMAGQLLEGFVLTPWLVGDKIGLHPVAVIFAVLAGGQLFGFVGVLLALPVAAVLMVFLRHLHLRYMDSEYYDNLAVADGTAAVVEESLPAENAEQDETPEQDAKPSE